jgi:ankyrin repeat protein
MWASSQGRVDTVAVLLEAGADVNAVDEDGVSALMWASGSEVTILTTFAQLKLHLISS